MHNRLWNRWNDLQHYYRRPLDDSEHIGDLTWAEEEETEANTGDTGARADKRGNSSKGK